MENDIVWLPIRQAIYGTLHTANDFGSAEKLLLSRIAPKKIINRNFVHLQRNTGGHRLYRCCFRQKSLRNMSVFSDNVVLLTGLNFDSVLSDVFDKG